MIFCNFLLCLIHKVSASHKPLCVKHINSVIHIPRPLGFLFFFAGQTHELIWLLSFRRHRLQKALQFNMLFFNNMFSGGERSEDMFFCTPPTGVDRHLCCLYEHCGHNDFYFVRYWYSSPITNVLCWDIDTPSRFHLPHLMLLRLDSVAKWFRWCFHSCSSLRYQAPLSHFQRREGGYSVLPNKSTCVLQIRLNVSFNEERSVICVSDDFPARGLQQWNCGKMTAYALDFF